MIGRGPDSVALSGAIESVPGLAEAVRLHGFLADRDKRDVVSGSLLHLNTSQGEGWGLCVLEAAALGVPTVAYDVEGLRDAVRDGETGWLVRESEQLADVVDRALKELSSPERRQAVASACRQWAARLDWGRSTARMAALIHASVQAGTSRARRPGAWIVAGPDGDVLAEGPVLDRLIEGGAEVRREATPLVRLSGPEPPGETHLASGPDRFSSLSEKRAQNTAQVSGLVTDMCYNEQAIPLRVGHTTQR